MPSVALVPIDARLAEALAAGPEEFARRMGPRLGPVADAVAEAVALALARPGARPPRWGGFLAMDAATAGIVGACAFHGPPDGHGTVEMSFRTFPPFERRGFATAMAWGLMARAKDAPEVRRVIAHVPEGDEAAARILRRLGLETEAEAEAQVDHPVWGRARRWIWERATFG